MGLIKKFIQINGVVASYHRINTIEKNIDDVEIIIHSYVDKKGRELEQKCIDLQHRVDFIQDWNIPAEEKESYDDIIADAKKEIGENYMEYYKHGTDFSISKMTIHLSYKDDLNYDTSMSNIYDVLVTKSPFDGAIPDND